MSDEAAFLRAVAQNPTDAAAKLVYADWLDEHSEPDRAAYLRLLATESPDPDRKRELAVRVGDIWGRLLNGPPTRWDEATLYALGGLERVLGTYRLFNERTSDLDLNFCARLVPNSDTIGELWRRGGTPLVAPSWSSRSGIGRRNSPPFSASGCSLRTLFRVPVSDSGSRPRQVEPTRSAR